MTTTAASNALIRAVSDRRPCRRRHPDPVDSLHVVVPEFAGVVVHTGLDPRGVQVTAGHVDE